MQSPQHRRSLHVFIASRVSCVEHIMISVNILDGSWKRQHSKWVEDERKGSRPARARHYLITILCQARDAAIKLKANHGRIRFHFEDGNKINSLRCQHTPSAHLGFTPCQLEGNGKYR